MIKDDIEEMETARHLMLTTKTAASGDLTEEDKDDRFEALRAMTTTLTESNGDNESDQEDSERHPTEERADSGGPYPFAYRFGEVAPSINARLSYDHQTQLHIAASGTPIVELIKRRLHP